MKQIDRICGRHSAGALIALVPVASDHVVPGLRGGAELMKRIATPMIGGVVTSAILNLLIYPVIYVIWRKRHLPKGMTT
jgi:Cu/Ag efflux pump CusA